MFETKQIKFAWLAKYNSDSKTLENNHFVITTWQLGNKRKTPSSEHLKAALIAKDRNHGRHKVRLELQVHCGSSSQ